MECSSCGHVNREGARFCAHCAAPLAESLTCPSCGAPQPAAARYCDSCGHALRAAAHPPEHLAEKIRAGRAALEGERKQVTVLFADLMGSMELAEQADPEEWRALMDRFFSILAEGVHRFEGTVDKFTGDGIMALFGAPIAHEDHARRACHAALHLQRELAGHAEELRRTGGLNFAVRMGLNSGEVVVGAVGDRGMAYTAVGHTVGLAQRMEQLAEPGRVYVTDGTASLVKGYLALTDLGEFNVKGASRPLRVHELTGLGEARGRLDVSRTRGFSRFVGRDQELQALEGALEQAFAGLGQVIGIVGEPGVGKSRLCHELADRARANGTPVYHVAGQAHTRAVPLLPVLQLLRAYFEIGERDSDRTSRERIAAKLRPLDERFDDDLALVFDFLAVADPERPLPRMDPDARQRRLLAVTKRLSRASSAREPGLTVVEDLHWLDPASEVFLANQVEAVQGTRSLVVVNFRPEYQAPWMARSYYRQIALAPLGADSIEQLLADLLGSDPSLNGLTELIRARTEGNPFFIEELVQELVESGSLAGERGAYRVVKPVAEAAVPASVQAALAARIDRLEQREKAVLEAAAVIGREFPAPILERVVELDPAELEDALRALVAAEFVYERELYPEALYAFKHPLTQEVAYRSQLGGRRALVHAEVARALAEQYPERLDERAALLAQHWEAAGETLEAARWHARAAVWAGTGKGNPAQTLWHWGRVGELAGSLPESAETIALGLSARMLSLAHAWRLGISHDDAEALFTEAEQFALRAGDIRSRAILLNGYGAALGVGEGDVRECLRLTRRSFALAEEAGDPALYLAISGGAYAFFCAGEYREAVAVCDRAIELAHGDPTVGGGVNYDCPYAWCHSFKGLVLAIMGELDQGRRLIDQAREIAREQGDAEVVGFSHMHAMYNAFFAGDSDAALRHARQAVEFAEPIGNSYARAYAWFCLGLAERMRDGWREAIDAIERAMAIATEGRTAIDGAVVALLADSYLGLGDTERARALAPQALETARAQGNLGSETLASLILARVLLGSEGLGARARIEEALARAGRLARDTDGRGIEPMIHVELAELARQSGDREARERELREAHRLFVQIGATGYAAPLELELAGVR